MPESSDSAFEQSCQKEQKGGLSTFVVTSSFPDIYLLTQSNGEVCEQENSAEVFEAFNAMQRVDNQQDSRRYRQSKEDYFYER